MVPGEKVAASFAPSADDVTAVQPRFESRGVHVTPESELV